MGLFDKLKDIGDKTKKAIEIANQALLISFISLFDVDKKPLILYFT